MRESRKLDHLKYTLQLSDGPAANGFADISLLHNCLPNLHWNEISLSGSLAGILLNHPVVINAITGGATDVTPINAKLAEFAKLTGSAMAVGSQYAAIENQSVRQSYEVVRKVNPDGVLIANLGAHASADQARLAVEMIGAAAIQIHLNAAQEIIMAEGDRDFRGYLDNIANIAATVGVPVFVKEVGCGIALEQAVALTTAGVSVIDVGGAGGTNFLAIEAARTEDSIAEDLLRWGIPTAISALEVVSVLPSGVEMMVSGGIRTVSDIVKSLAIGGKAVGMAAPIVTRILRHDVGEAVIWFEGILEDIRKCLLLVGAKTLYELTDVPLIVTGNCREWMTVRQVDINKYATRCKHG